jgi:hypothetical protein
MQRLEVSGAVRPIEGSLGVKGLKWCTVQSQKSLSLALLCRIIFKHNQKDATLHSGIYY